jgi:hypothetical protein
MMALKLLVSLSSLGTAIDQLRAVKLCSMLGPAAHLA